MPRPTRKPARPDPNSLSLRLREILRGCGRPAAEVARAAGVDPGVLSRFTRGERSVSLDTADRLARALRLRLVEAGRGRAARPDAPPENSPDFMVT